MTVPATTRRAGPFNGNGSATSFPFTFKVFAKADVQVQVTSAAAVTTTLVLDSDYSVSVNTDQDASPGGTITYPISGAPLATGEKLVALGAIEYNQVTDLPAGGAYRAKVVEDALDRTVFQIQQLAEENSRALTLPASAATADTTLPAPAAGSVIGWDTSAQALVNYAPADLATVVVAGTSYTDIFSGTGSQVAFLLTANPGSVNALDIAISGVSQVNGVDFTVSGTTLTFTSAPAAGTGNIAVRYVAAVPVGSANAQDVTFLPSGIGVSLQTVEAELRRGVVRPEWWGAKFDSAYVSGASTGTDDTVAIQAAVNFAAYMAGGAGSNFPVNQPVTVELPAGDAIISAGITANRRVRIRGQGCWATRLICKTGGTSFYGITLRPNGAGGCPIIGAEVSDLQIVGDGGGTRCSGIDTGSTAPYTITKTNYRNLVIWNTATGMSIGDGVDNSFYNNNFENILVTGGGATGVATCGIRLNSAVYCRFSGIEVTGVGPTAHAFYGTAGWGTFSQLACDGVSNLDIPHGTIVNFTVEGIIAATTAADTVLAINRAKLLAGVTLIDCPNAKTPYGMTINASGATVIGMAVSDTGGGQPNYPFLPASGTTGTLLGFSSTNPPPFKVEVVANAATMQGWLWSDCPQLTTYGYATELQGSVVYDPPSLADGAGVTTTVTVTGAALGDHAKASFSVDLVGLTLTAWVSAANTVSVRFQNESGGTVDLASGTLRARVSRA